jgi:LysM repeat protein/ParB-like chromosome segregation protein Spo0J
MARINFQFADGFIEKRRQDTSVIGNQYLENIILYALSDRRHRWRHAGEFWRLAHELQANQAQKKYTVADGDTLDSICTRAGYGQEILYYLNPGINFRLLEAGTVLSLPPAADIGTYANETAASVIPADSTRTDEQRAADAKLSATKQQPEIAGKSETLPAAADNAGVNNTTQPENTSTQTLVAPEKGTAVNSNPAGNEIINNAVVMPVQEDDLVALDSIWTNDAPVKEANTADTQTELVMVSTPPLVLPADRSDIVSIYRELTAEQKEKYHWAEMLQAFTDAQPKVNAANLASWTRKKLKDGWNFGDPVPLLMAAVQDGEKNGAPVIEAYSFSSAWQYADKTLHLPKNADAPFYWRRKFSGKMSYHFLNYSSNTAWQNFVNLKDHADWDAAKLLLDVSGDQSNYDAVIKIKTYNDQLLSESFVSLVISAQSRIYAADADSDTKVNGVFTLQTKTDIKAYQDKKAATEKAAAIEKNKLFGEDGILSTTPGIYKFKRTLPDGVADLKVNKVKWLLLRSYLKSTADTDYIVDYVSLNFPPGDKESKDIFYMLTHAERIKILEAYEKESWLWEYQEKIVNMLIENTPIDKDPSNAAVTNLRTSLWNWLNANNRYHYNEIMEDQENDETRRGYYSSNEEVSIQKTGDIAQVDKTPEQLIVKYAESPSTWEALHSTLPGMSDRQLAAIGYTVTGSGTTAVRQFNGASLTKVIAAESGLLLINKLYSGEGLYRLLKFAGDDGYLKGFLGGNNNYWLDMVCNAMGDSLRDKLMTDRLDRLFTNDSRSKKKALELLTNKSALGSGRDYEDFLSNLPSTVYAGMNENEQADLIMLICNGAYTDGTDEETIIRIVESAGLLAKTKKPNKTKEEEKAEEDLYNEQRRKLYYAIHRRDPGLAKLKSAFQMYNEDKLLLKINELNNWIGKKDYATDLKAADDYSKDDVIRSMPASAMAQLTLEERENYIRIILGRTPEADAARATQAYGTLTGVVLFTRVGQADEEAIIRLLNTTPADQITGLLAWMQANHGEFYQELHSAIDGDQFKQLHDTLDGLANSKLEAETANDPAKIKQLDALREAMLFRGASHPKVVPWADPGFFKQFYADKSFQYIVSWVTVPSKTKGKSEEMISLMYYDPRDWKGGITSMKQKGPFSPWEYIGVEFLEDDSDLNADRGEIRMMPAIYLFFLKNKQTQRQIGEALDLIFLAVGVGEFMAAAKAIEAVIALIDVALTVGSLVTNSYKEEIPKDLKAAFDVANAAFSFYQVAKLGKVVVEESWQLAEKFITKLDDAIASGKLTGGAAKTMQAEADRLRQMKKLAEEIDDANLDELRAMQKKVNDSGLTANQKADINADLGNRIKSREHNLKYEADRKRISESNKTHTDAGDGAPKNNAASTSPAPVMDTRKAVASATDNGNAFTIKHPEWGEVRFIRRDGKWFLVNAKNYPDDIRIKIAQRYSPENMDKLREAWLKTKDPNTIKNPDDVLDAGGDGAKTVKEPEAVKEPEKTKEPDAVKEDVNAQSVDETRLTEAELQKIEDDLLAQEGARTWRDEAAEEFLAKQNAKAMYLPGEPGKPGVLVFSRNATRAEVLEEIKHLKQHKSLKFASLSTEEIIKLEIEAQQQLSRYAKMKGWSDAEIKQFDDNLKYWEAKQAEYARGGDAAKAVDAEVSGFRMADENDIIIKRFGIPPLNSNVLEIEISKLTKIHDAPKFGREDELVKIEEILKKDGWNMGSPIPVIELPDGTLLVVDGHHRIFVMEKLGQKTIPVDIMSPRDAKYRYGEQNFSTLVEIGKQSGYYKGTYIPTGGAIHERAIDQARMFLETNFPKK